MKVTAFTLAHLGAAVAIAGVAFAWEWSWHEQKGYLATLRRMRTMGSSGSIESPKLMSETIRDAWGEAIAYRCFYKQEYRSCVIASGGPDRDFDSETLGLLQSRSDDPRILWEFMTKNMNKPQRKLSEKWDEDMVIHLGGELITGVSLEDSTGMTPQFLPYVVRQCVWRFGLPALGFFVAAFVMAWRPRT